MSISINDGGTIRTLKIITINDGGTLRTLNTITTNDGGTLRRLFGGSGAIPTVLRWHSWVKGNPDETTNLYYTTTLKDNNTSDNSKYLYIDHPKNSASPLYSTFFNLTPDIGVDLYINNENGGGAIYLCPASAFPTTNITTNTADSLSSSSVHHGSTSNGTFTPNTSDGYTGRNKKSGFAEGQYFIVAAGGGGSQSNTWSGGFEINVTFYPST